MSNLQTALRRGGLGEEEAPSWVFWHTESTRGIDNIAEELQLQIFWDALPANLKLGFITCCVLASYLGDNFINLSYTLKTVGLTVSATRPTISIYFRPQMPGLLKNRALFNEKEAAGAVTGTSGNYSIGTTAAAFKQELGLDKLVQEISGPLVVTGYRACPE
ncbi:hypothetical protein PoB_000279700 [Plakobranchus ocellatus]|uniref:Uncharacterized protein n=1 Tax=Plakobranchus ocellatus TaxID=259542 RepID=A0AAV3Y0J9_9GAST|nr:hypothetical protein PoB_000279700 [Plakobranchus ocellatus]